MLRPCRILQLPKQLFPGEKAAAKISSDSAFLELRLVPKPKLILELRDLFANAYIVGWKFELEGTPEDVVQEGVRQIQLNRTNACMVNGAPLVPGSASVPGTVWFTPPRPGMNWQTGWRR